MIQYNGLQAPLMPPSRAFALGVVPTAPKVKRWRGSSFLRTLCAAQGHRLGKIAMVAEHDNGNDAMTHRLHVWCARCWANWEKSFTYDHEYRATVPEERAGNEMTARLYAARWEMHRDIVDHQNAARRRFFLPMADGLVMWGLEFTLITIAHVDPPPPDPEHDPDVVRVEANA